MKRLGALAERAKITETTDKRGVVADLPQAAVRSRRPLAVVVECDTRRRRSGIETPVEVLALAKQIAAMPTLELAGLLFYPTEPGWPAAQAFLDEAMTGLRAKSLDPKIVSTGGTPNLKISGD